MPRDVHANALRPVLPEHENAELAASAAATDTEPASGSPGAARGVWCAMTWRTRLLLGGALLGLAGGGAWSLLGEPNDAWAEAVQEPGSAPGATAAGRRRDPASVADRRSAAAPAPAARPAAGPQSAAAEAVQRRASETPPAGASAVPPPMPMASPAATPAPPGQGEPAEPGADPAPDPPEPRAAPEAPAPAPQAEADPLAEVRRLAAQASRPRPPAPAPAPDPERARLAAMVTDLSAITKQVLERQVQAERLAEAAQAALARRLADIEQRLTFAEARAAVSATVAAAGAPAPAAGAPPAAQPAATPVRPASAAGPRAPVAGPHSYQIKAASPGMAVLAVRNPMPGQQAVLEIRIGDEVPGLGKAVRIGQRGTVWEVQTPGGTIEQ